MGFHIPPSVLHEVTNGFYSVCFFLPTELSAEQFSGCDAPSRSARAGKGFALCSSELRHGTMALRFRDVFEGLI